MKSTTQARREGNHPQTLEYRDALRRGWSIDYLERRRLLVRDPAGNSYRRQTWHDAGRADVVITFKDRVALPLALVMVAPAPVKQSTPATPRRQADLFSGAA